MSSRALRHLCSAASHSERAASETIDHDMSHLPSGWDMLVAPKTLKSVTPLAVAVAAFAVLGLMAGCGGGSSNTSHRQAVTARGDRIAHGNVTSPSWGVALARRHRRLHGFNASRVKRSADHSAAGGSSPPRRERQTVHRLLHAIAAGRGRLIRHRGPVLSGVLGGVRAVDPSSQRERTRSLADGIAAQVAEDLRSEKR